MCNSNHGDIFQTEFQQLFNKEPKLDACCKQFQWQGGEKDSPQKQKILNTLDGLTEVDASGLRNVITKGIIETFLTYK